MGRPYKFGSGESEVADGTVAVKDLRPVSKRQWRRTASPRICALYWAGREGQRGNLRERIRPCGMRLNALAENGKSAGCRSDFRLARWLAECYWSSHQTESARAASSAYRIAVTAVSADKPDSIPAAEKIRG